MGRAYGHTQSAAARYSTNPRKSGMTITPTIVPASISVLFVMLELERYIFFMCNFIKLYRWESASTPQKNTQILYVKMCQSLST